MILISLIISTYAGETTTSKANNKGRTLFSASVSCKHIARDDAELSMNEGEILDILEIAEPHWWIARNQIGEIGEVPSNRLKLLSKGKIHRKKGKTHRNLTL